MSQKLRVIIVAPRPMSAQAGGITRMVGYLQQAVMQAAYPVELAIYPTRLTEKSILNHLSTPLALMNFALGILLWRPDLVHIHVAPGTSTWRKYVFALVARAFRRPIILHLHGSGYDQFFAGQSAVRQRQIRRFFSIASGVIVLGNVWKDFATTGLQLPDKKVHIIDNGAPEPDARAVGYGASPRIAFVGTVGHRKGVDLLLKGLAELPPQTEWQCIICGGGEVEKFKALGQQLGLSSDKVTFAGWQTAEQVREHLIHSDIFVLPSRAENQPVAILEAMALGLPVVATAIGDIPNQVLDGVTGYLVKPDDAASLKNALEKLLASSQDRAKFGMAGRKRYEQNYSIQKNAEKTIALYQLLKKKTGE